MKKLTTLLFALLFTAGIAFGQNSATTTQNGNNNNATVSQHNSGNTATVKQINGASHDYVLLNQTYVSSSASSDVNEADITQMGSHNTVKNNTNYDGAVQVGGGNHLKINQLSSGNRVENVHQGRNGRLSTNGSIDITQGTSGSTPYNNYNRIQGPAQYGNGNALTVTQRDENRVDIKAQVSTGQTGNNITIHQTGGESSVGRIIGNHGNGYGAYQKGTNNSMNISQKTHDNAGSQTVDNVFSNVDAQGHGGQSLVQLGSDNSLTIDQASGSAYRPQGLGSNTVKAVLQNGLGNNASITQGMGPGNTAVVAQQGIGNSSNITQN